MPYTTEQRRNIVINAGQNPEEYDFDEASSSLVPRLSFKSPAISQPEPTTNQPPANSRLSRGQAALAVGKRAALPTIGGGLLGGLAAAPISGGWSIPIGLGAGILGALGIGFGQEKVLENVQGPEDYQKGLDVLKQAREQYPVQSFGVEAAPGLLMGRPSLKSFTGAGKLLKGNKFSSLVPEEQAATKLAGIQAGIGAGTDVASQTLLEGEDKEYNPLRTVGAAGVGALLSKPQLLGKTKAFGYRPPPPDQSQPTGKLQGPPIPDFLLKITPQEQRSATGTELDVKLGMDLPTYARPDIQAKTAEDAGRVFNQRGMNQPAVPVEQQSVTEIPGFKLKPKTSSLSRRLRTSEQLVNERFGLPQKSLIKKIEFESPDQAQPTAKIAAPVSQEQEQTVPQQIEKETGWRFKQAGAVQGLTPEQLAILPEHLKKPQWEFSDAREGSPTKTATTYLPEGTSYEQALAHVKAKEAEILAKDKAYIASKTPTTTASKIDTTLDSLKIDTSGGTLHAFGIAADVWNTAIDGVKLAVKTGSKVSEAIESAIKKIKETNPSFDENGARTFLQGAKLSDLNPESSVSSAPKVETTSYNKEFTIPGIRSGIDTIAATGTPTSKKVSSAFTDFYAKFRALKGEYTSDINSKLLSRINPFKTPKDWILQDNESNRKVLFALYKESDFKRPAEEISNFTPEERDIYNTLRGLLIKSANDQVSRGIPVEGAGGNKRQRGSDPFYFPHVIDSEVINTILKNPSSPEALKFRQDFVEYRTTIKGQKLEEAAKEWDDLLAAFGGTQTNIASQFGPVDKVEGKGLPISMREKNLINATNKYFNRVARRFAYFDAVESSPDIRTALGIKTDVTGEPTIKSEGIDNIAGNEDVVAVLNDISGNRSRKELKREATSGVIRSLMLGFQTGAVDFTTNLSGGLHYFTPGQTVKALGSAFKDYKSNLEASFKTGVNRHNIGNIEASVSGLNEVVSGANRFRDAINTVQLRNTFEKATRAIAFGKGKYVVLDNLNYFRSSNTKSSQRERFLDTYGPSDWRERLNNITEKDINEAAAKYVEDVQGSYDYRQLPAIAVEGSLAPFLSLSRWNIAQANRFTKNVLNPALKGDIKPLVMSLLSPLIGGVAVKELREKLSGGRKSKTPDIAEIVATNPDNYKAWFYKLATLADYSGYAGLMGNSLKIIADTVHKNPTQAFTNPLVDGIADTFRLAQDAIQAFNDGEFELGVNNVSKAIENYAQTYRILANNLSEQRQQEIGRANENRDLRVFKQLTDKPVSDISRYGSENIFSNKDVKQFKNTEDIREASGLLKERILPRFTGDLKQTKDISGFQQRLRGLKGIPTISMPSPESDLAGFTDYNRFLAETQGPEIARGRAKSYFRRLALNRAKSQMVP